MQDLSLSGPVAYLIRFNFCLVGACILFLGVLFLPQAWQQPFLNLGQKVPVLGHQIFKTLQQFWIIGRNRPAVLKALGMSIISQSMCVLAFWVLIIPFVPAHLAWASAFTFIPIGFITIAIPISPAGLGIGHAIFDELFHCFGVENGASLFNIYFVVMVLVNLQGLWPYLWAGRRYQVKEVDLTARTQEIVVDYQALNKKNPR
jgi:hypothetical protein